MRNSRARSLSTWRIHDRWLWEKPWMNRISGPDGLPHSCAEMVRPSGVFTLIGLCFGWCPRAGCAIATRKAATVSLARRLPGKDIVIATPLIDPEFVLTAPPLEDALRHLELPAGGSQPLRENLPDPRVFIRIVDSSATGIRHQRGGERVEIVVPAAELHEACRDLAVVEMLVEPLQRRHHERSFLPFEELHLLLLAVLEGRGADLVRPHHAETAAVEKDDGRARPVAVAALVSARRELLHVTGHAVARHRQMVVVVIDALARGIELPLPDVGNEVYEGVRVVAALLGLSAPVAGHGGKEGLRRRAEVILAAVKTLREDVVVVEDEIGVPEHVDEERRVGNGHQAHRILAGIDVAVPRIERRGKDGAFFPLESEHVPRIALPDLRPSFSGQHERLLLEEVALRIGLASRRNLGDPRVDRSRGALQENVGAERAYALPRLELDLVHVDRAALVDGNAFLLQEAPVSARPVEGDRVVVGIGPRLGGLGCLGLSLCAQGSRRAGRDSGQAHAQELGTGEAYFFDGVAGWLAVQMRREPVMRVLMLVVGMTVVLMITIEVGHKGPPEEFPVTIAYGHKISVLTQPAPPARGNSRRLKCPTSSIAGPQV